MERDGLLAGPPGLYGHHGLLRRGVHALSLSHILVVGSTRHVGHLSSVRWASWGSGGWHGDCRRRILNPVLIDCICRGWRRSASASHILPLHCRHGWWNGLHILELPR